MDIALSSLIPELSRNLGDLGWHQLTPIQSEALPIILEGKDVIGVAKTGSGKTGAFALGMLNGLDVSGSPYQIQVQGLVLTPTRELADQVTREIRRLARYMANTKVLSLYGGTPMGPQLGSLRRGAHIIVGTPGRIAKHLAKGSLNFSAVKTVVLDEADRMLDMGFEEEVTGILSQVLGNHQTMLFSATFQDEVQAMCEWATRNAEVIDVTTDEVPNPIEEIAYLTFEDEREADLAALLSVHDPDQAIVFCNMKVDCNVVVKQLKSRGWSAAALHGDMEQKDRDLTMILFKQQSIRILVATDVAARGLDIDQLDAVINYELPHQEEIYVHRIGRTGRAGEPGLALSLYSENDVQRLPEERDIQRGKLTSPNQLPKQQKENHGKPRPPATHTLCISGGRKDKLRPGDIVGALTSAGAGLAADDIGKIHLRDHDAFVAVVVKQSNTALDLLNNSKIKGRRFKVRRL